MVVKNKILTIFGSIWTNLDQNRGLIRSNNTENDVKIDDLKRPKSKKHPITPKKAVKRKKTPKNGVFLRFREISSKISTDVQP